MNDVLKPQYFQSFDPDHALFHKPYALTLATFPLYKTKFVLCKIAIATPKMTPIYQNEPMYFCAKKHEALSFYLDLFLFL